MNKKLATIYRRDKQGLKFAIKSAYENKIAIYIYFDKIMVKMSSEEDCYLKYTPTIESFYYNRFEDFERDVMSCVPWFIDYFTYSIVGLERAISTAFENKSAIYFYSDEIQVHPRAKEDVYLADIKILDSANYDKTEDFEEAAVDLFVSQLRYSAGEDS